MKIVQLKCPACGGELKVEDGLETFYCQYCGQRIILSEQDKGIIAAKVFNRFLEHREQMYEKKAEEDRKRRKEADRQVWIALLFMFLIAVFFTILVLKTGK